MQDVNIMMHHKNSKHVLAAAEMGHVSMILNGSAYEAPVMNIIANSEI
jgi:hypothetical protein